jgi:hypothetical protein
MKKTPEALRVRYQRQNTARLIRKLDKIDRAGLNEGYSYSHNAGPNGHMERTRGRYNQMSIIEEILAERGVFLVGFPQHDPEIRQAEIRLIVSNSID